LQHRVDTWLQSLFYAICGFDCVTVIAYIATVHSNSDARIKLLRRIYELPFIIKWTGQLAKAVSEHDVINADITEAGFSDRTELN